MTRRWYAVQILPNLVRTAVANLHRQDFETFIPEVITRTAIRETREPLFKGYIFTRFDIDASAWWSINGTYGVVKLLPKYREYPLPFKEGFVERLQQTSPHIIEKYTEVFHHFMPNTSVEIISGILRGRRAKFLRKSGRFAEIIFLETLDRGHAIKIPISALRPADSFSAGVR